MNVTCYNINKKNLDFILHCLFNDAVSSSDNINWKVRMISEIISWELCGKK